uniref:Cytochrome P450 n=1 Tax=Kalanchoe fedtschenkoi TaxID=63787 RepID=A0A7N0T568_KALFE
MSQTSRYRAKLAVFLLLYYELPGQLLLTPSVLSSFLQHFERHRPKMENLLRNLYAMDPLLLACPLLISLVLLLFLPGKSRPRAPPSPPRLPVIGNLHQLTTRPNHALQVLARKYGPLIKLHIGPAPVYVVSSAEMAREVTVTQESSFPARPKSWAADVLFSGGTDLIFSSYGHYWRQTRKLCVNELLSVRRVQSFQYIREEEVGKLVAKIRLSCAEEADRVEINLGHLLLKLANDIVSRAVLGQKYTGEGDASEIMGALSRKASELTGAFSFRDFVPALSWLDSVTGFAGRVAKTSGALDAFLNQVIDEHEIPSGNADDLDDRKDFVDIIFQLQKEDRIGLDLTLDNVKAILLDMFVAGTDTSASTMEWMMAELVRKPSAMKRMVAHLFNHSIITHRDPETWDRPSEFLPERFLNSSLGYKGQDSEYFPFGLGRRICPGAQFAAAEVEYAMANLLCWFDWRLPEGTTAETLDMSDTFAQVPSKKIPLRLVPVPRTNG